MKIDEFGLITKDGKDCPKCMDLIIKIRRGELTGTVLSCHPLDQIIDEDLAQYIESREMSPN